MNPAEPACVYLDMDLKISSPCPMSWDSLVGDNRVRYCGACRLNVYNFAEMAPAEVEQVVRATEGRLCGRLYLRGDRTATVRDCPRSAVRRRVRAALMVAFPILLGAVTWFCWTSEQPNLGATPPWVQAVLDWVHPPKPPPRALVGEIPAPRCPPTQPQ